MQHAPAKRIVGRYASIVDFRTLFNTAKRFLDFKEDPSEGYSETSIYFIITQGLISSIYNAKFATKHDEELSISCLKIKEEIEAIYGDYEADELLAKEINNFKNANKLRTASVLCRNFRSVCLADSYLNLQAYIAYNNQSSYDPTKNIHISAHQDIIKLIEDDLHHWVFYHYFLLDKSNHHDQEEEEEHLQELTEEHRMDLEPLQNTSSSYSPPDENTSPPHSSQEILYSQAAPSREPATQERAMYENTTRSQPQFTETPPLSAQPHYNNYRVTEYDINFPPVLSDRVSPAADPNEINIDQFVNAPPIITNTYAKTLNNTDNTNTATTKNINHNGETIITVNTDVMIASGYFTFKNKLLSLTHITVPTDQQLQQLLLEEPQWLLDHPTQRGRIVLSLLSLGSQCHFKIKSTTTKKGEVHGSIKDTTTHAITPYTQIAFSNIPRNTLTDEIQFTRELTSIALLLGQHHQVHLRPEIIQQVIQSRNRAHNFTGDSLTVVIKTTYPIHLSQPHYTITSTNKTTIQNGSRVVKYHHTYGITFLNDLDIHKSSLLLVIRGPTIMDYAFIGQHIKHVLSKVIVNYEFDILAYPTHFHWTQPHYCEATMPCFIVVLTQDIDKHSLQEQHRHLNIHNQTCGLLKLGDRSVEMCTDFIRLQNVHIHTEVCKTQRALKITGCQALTLDIITNAIPEHKRQDIDSVVLLSDGTAYVLLKSTAPTNFKNFDTDPLLAYVRPDNMPMVTSFHFGFTDHPSKQFNPFSTADTRQSISRPSSSSTHSKNLHDYEVVGRNRHALRNGKKNK
jgi:hypothetical protein